MGSRVSAGRRSVIRRPRNAWGNRDGKLVRIMQSAMPRFIAGELTTVEKNAKNYLRLIKDAKNQLNVKVICSVGMHKLLNHPSINMRRILVVDLTLLRSLISNNVFLYTPIPLAQISAGILKTST